MLRQLAALPVVGNKSISNQLVKLEKAIKMSRANIEQIARYKDNHWYFDSTELTKIYHRMTPDE